MKSINVTGFGGKGHTWILLHLKQDEIDRREQSSWWERMNGPFGFRYVSGVTLGAVQFSLSATVEGSKSCQCWPSLCVSPSAARWETTRACYSRWRTPRTTRALRTKHQCGSSVLQTLTNCCTTSTKSRGSGCTWSPSLAGAPCPRSRLVSNAWMMTSGQSGLHGAPVGLHPFCSWGSLWGKQSVYEVLCSVDGLVGLLETTSLEDWVKFQHLNAIRILSSSRTTKNEKKKER